MDVVVQIHLVNVKQYKAVSKNPGDSSDLPTVHGAAWATCHQSYCTYDPTT